MACVRRGGATLESGIVVEAGLGGVGVGEAGLGAGEQWRWSKEKRAEVYHHARFFCGKVRGHFRSYRAGDGGGTKGGSRSDERGLGRTAAGALSSFVVDGGGTTAVLAAGEVTGGGVEGFVSKGAAVRPRTE